MFIELYNMCYLKVYFLCRVVGFWSSRDKFNATFDCMRGSYSSGSLDVEHQ